MLGFGVVLCGGVGCVVGVLGGGWGWGRGVWDLCVGGGGWGVWGVGGGVWGGGCGGGGGGRLTWTTVTSRLQVFLIYAPQATVTYLRVWYSVHFGYYFYASRGDILVVKFSGS